MTTPILRTPTRYIFIASIGNPAPYQFTRHSAGHIARRAIEELLPPRRTRKSPPTDPYYNTWASPSYMNICGTKLVRRLNTFLDAYRKDYATEEQPERPTLILLHDELEAKLGEVKVRRGGAEESSLRGHRGLISVMASLKGKGVYPPREGEKKERGLSIARIGIGIGRPESRTSDAVAEYVLTEMNQKEMEIVGRAAKYATEIIMEEFYRPL